MVKIFARTDTEDRRNILIERKGECMKRIIFSSTDIRYQRCERGKRELQEETDIIHNKFGENIYIYIYIYIYIVNLVRINFTMGRMIYKGKRSFN